MLTLASASEEDVAMTAILCTFFFLVIWVVVHHWRKHRVAAYNARLKQLMIERGMSAREINEVLEAGGSQENQDGRRCG